MLARLVVGAALVGALLSSCSGDDSADSSATPVASDVGSSEDRDLAGDLGPNGLVSHSGVEMQSGPGSLYVTQAQGGTAVGPVSGVTAGLTAIRDAEQLCLEVHGLPIGANRLAGTCDLPAYESHDDVAETGWAYVSDAVVDGEPVRIAWGMTYLDAVTADFGPGTRSQAMDSTWPFWMHRFFALVPPPGAQELRLLDDSGQEMITLPLQPS